MIGPPPGIDPALPREGGGIGSVGGFSPTGIHRRHYTSLVALVFLPVAVVVDDPVDHVSRPVNVRLVSHHRHIVLAVLVALLVNLHRHPAAVLDLADLVAPAADDELHLLGVDLERFRLGRGRVDSRGSTWGTAGATAAASAAATVAESTAGTVPSVTAAATTVAAASATAPRAVSTTSTATASSASVAASTAAVVPALPVIAGASAAVSAALGIVTFPPVWHGQAFVAVEMSGATNSKSFYTFHCTFATGNCL